MEIEEEINRGREKKNVEETSKQCEDAAIWFHFNILTGRVQEDNSNKHEWKASS